MLRFTTSVSLALTVLLLTAFHPTFAEDHHHHEKGPHKGDLVELGDEEYHAEVVHDEKEATVTVYLLGSDAKTPVATDAKELVINTKVKGKGVQTKLKPSPQKGDKPGASSRFSLKSKELIELLEDPSSNPALRIAINGKTYNGKIEHDHEHEKSTPKKK